MLRAMKVSMGVFNKVFSPDQFRQARILESRADPSFAGSFAQTHPPLEAIEPCPDTYRAIRRLDKVDTVTFVTAHEQTTMVGASGDRREHAGHDDAVRNLRVIFGDVVMEHLDGSEDVREFLEEELDAYLRARGSEEVGGIFRTTESGPRHTSTTARGGLSIIAWRRLSAKTLSTFAAPVARAT